MSTPAKTWAPWKAGYRALTPEQQSGVDAMLSLAMQYAVLKGRKILGLGA